jgi:hypothetical protein
LVQKGIKRKVSHGAKTMMKRLQRNQEKEGLPQNRSKQLDKDHRRGQVNSHKSLQP